MSECNAPQPAPPAAARSRKLTIAVIALAILPLLLPVPLYILAGQWIVPVLQEHFQQCTDIDCFNQTLVDGYRLVWLLILGPSILFGMASILLGSIGRFRERRHPTSPKNMALFETSIACGVIWTILFACSYGVAWVLSAITD